MTIVGFQVIRLKPHPEEGYEVVPALPFSDEQGGDARQALASAGPFEHRPVFVHSLGSGEGFYLAAFPADDGEPFLELDEKGDPLAASDRALEAIELSNRLIDEGVESPEVAAAVVREIWSLLGEDDGGLRELLFERLYQWASDGEIVEGVPTLYWLLPWSDFMVHLKWLAFVVRHADRSDLPPSEEPEWRLPEIGHSFKSLIPGLAPALREITEWRSPEAPITNISVRLFTQRFRLLTPDKVPPDIRDELCGHAEDVGRRFQRRLEVDWLSNVEHILAAQVMIDLYELLLDWGAPLEDDVDAGRIKWLGRIALAANAGYFGAGRVKLRQQTVEELREMAQRLQSEGLWFEQRAASDERWWDRILDAGFILYVAASMALTIHREPASALGLAQAARGAFERFGQKMPPYRVQRWANTFPEVHLLEARSAIDVHDFAAAVVALRAMEEALEMVEAHLGSHTLQLYRAQLSIRLAEVVECDPEAAATVGESQGMDRDALVGAASRICEEVIEANFANKKAWRMLIPLIPADQVAGRIESVLERERSTALRPPQQETLDWLEYQLAVAARQRADEMPELILGAFESYAGLLASQPRNLPAVQELLEMYSDMRLPQEEEARELLDKALAPMADSDVPVAHAAVRWAIRGEVPEAGTESNAAHAIPLVGAEAASDSGRQSADLELEDLLATKYGRRLLETISKWIYERARSSGDLASLRAVGRLLDPAIAADPNDAIWWSRRADVALSLHDAPKADALLEEIATTLHNDAIARFQIGRLRLLRGEFSAADEELIEAEFLDREKTGEANPNPAIADRRGFIALREHRYEAAEAQYRQILEDNWTDPAAHYGLGRVYLQSPFHSLRDAMHHWRIALRLRTTDPSSFSRHYSWRTAAGIAGMIDRQAKSGESAAHAGALHEELDELLAIEDAVVGEHVVKALRVRGVTDPDTATILQRVKLPSLARSVAQYLMARTIHLYIEEPSAWPRFVDDDLPRYLAWCEERGVLGDFLAGAKGSYARAHMRAEIAGRRARLPQPEDLTEVSARKLKKLVDHVVETAYSASYYEDAYGYLRAAGQAKEEQTIAVVCQIVSRLARQIRVETEAAGAAPGRHRLLDELRPSVGLEAVGTAVQLPEGDELTAYVDLDALLYAKSVQRLDSWTLTSTQLVGLTTETIPAEDRRSYARAGIGWEVPSEDGRQRCVIDLIDAGFEAQDVGVAASSSQPAALA